MPAQLIALDHGSSILLDKPILLLGRHPECDIQIDSRKISRRHCCIAQVSDYLVVRDLGSTNGIRINGTRVVEGRLNAGDELTIGNYRYKVAWDTIPAAVPPSPARSSPPPSKRAKPGETPRKPQAPKPSPVADIEDEMLEACDEPVALDESEADAALPDRPSMPKPLPPIKGKFLHLPDDLGLMPNQELSREDSPLASPSGSHPPT
jgi:predicted component of type VI protein secretion system